MPDVLVAKLPIQIVRTGAPDSPRSFLGLIESLVLRPLEPLGPVWEMSDEAAWKVRSHATDAVPLPSEPSRGEARFTRALLDQAQRSLRRLGMPYLVQHLHTLAVETELYVFVSADGEVTFESVAPNPPETGTIVLLWPRDLRMQDWYAIWQQEHCVEPRETPAELMLVRFPESLPVLVDFLATERLGLHEAYKDPLLCYQDVAGLDYLLFLMAGALSLPLVHEVDYATCGDSTYPLWADSHFTVAAAVVTSRLHGWWRRFDNVHALLSLHMWQIQLGFADKTPTETLDYLLERFADPSWPRLADRFLQPPAEKRRSSP